MGELLHAFLSHELRFEFSLFAKKDKKAARSCPAKPVPVKIGGWYGKVGFLGPRRHDLFF